MIHMFISITSYAGQNWRSDLLESADTRLASHSSSEVDALRSLFGCTTTYALADKSPG